ncbi:MAG: helix-turn-helix transcriptional regulator [Acidobacteria bacterium]|nr:helix-turn-helix transcriptional regulator [Acidobacteriota bacterium]
MPRSAQSAIDKDFWERLRGTLRKEMVASGLRQKDLAAKLGIDTTTLNNFLNHQNKSLGGLAVALACTMVDLTCDGKTIGRLQPARLAEQPLRTSQHQLELEFDNAFEIKADAKVPTLVIRKPATRTGSVRLAIRVG